MFLKVNVFFLFLCLAAVNFSLPSDAEASYKRNVNSFVRMMAKKHHFKPRYIRGLLRKAKKKKSILDAIRRPAESKPWYQYRGFFISEKRIQRGVNFWRQHEHTLRQAEQKYGVPAEIIAGIIGVETRFGSHTGGYRVLDALYTLGFHYPRRGRFFRAELAHFLVMTREEKLDPLRVKGSYAGALGWPQFMPSSFRRYAVDFNNDGKRDLIQSEADAIGSVANYLAKKGWQKDGLIALPAQIDGNRHRAILKKGIRPRQSIDNLKAYGITPKQAPEDGSIQAALFKLELQQGEEYWLGLKNFYVITRYNPSTHYAMAVVTLGKEVKARAHPDDSTDNNVEEAKYN